MEKRDQLNIALFPFLSEPWDSRCQSTERGTKATDEIDHPWIGKVDTKMMGWWSGPVVIVRWAHLRFLEVIRTHG